MDFLKQYLNVKRYELLCNRNVIYNLNENINSIDCEISVIEQEIKFAYNNIDEYMHDFNRLILLERYIDTLKQNVQNFLQERDRKKKSIEEMNLKLQNQQKVYDNLNELYNKYICDKIQKIEEKEVNELIELCSIHKHIGKI